MNNINMKTIVDCVCAPNPKGKLQVDSQVYMLCIVRIGQKAAHIREAKFDIRNYRSTTCFNKNSDETRLLLCLLLIKCFLF